MHAAVLSLAVGNVAYLEDFIAAAESDFRDVLWWGEYSVGKDMRCVVCEKDEGVTDPTEEVFLELIRKNPRDNATRLVYADWLEDRGDPRAEYLRVLCEWLACRRTEDRRLVERERELRTSLSRRWLARVRGMPVRDRTEKKRGRKEL